jgi:uncharacterized protein (TIGR02444 family)
VDRGSEFWRFSLAFYRSPGVPNACIVLQDLHGLDVNVMLFALWLGSQGRAVSATDIMDADAAVRDWREQVVVELRGVRRFLRNPPPVIDGAPASALRDKVKAVELESERLQQEALFALRPVAAWGRDEAAPRSGDLNISACEESLGVVFDAAAREALLAAYRDFIKNAKP